MMKLQFGSLVKYQPTGEREDSRRAKYAPRTLLGIFMGYKLQAGSAWKGAYLVPDAELYQEAGGTNKLAVLESDGVPPLQYPCKSGKLRPQGFRDEVWAPGPLRIPELDADTGLEDTKEEDVDPEGDVAHAGGEREIISGQFQPLNDYGVEP